jgi:hypothetical protein
MEVTGQFHAPAALLPGEQPPWVGPRAGVDAKSIKLVSPYKGGVVYVSIRYVICKSCLD